MLRCPDFFMNPLDHLSQTAYKLDRLNFEDVTSLDHHICNPVNSPMKFVICGFLDSSSTFNSVPRSPLFSTNNRVVKCHNLSLTTRA